MISAVCTKNARTVMKWKKREHLSKKKRDHLKKNTIKERKHV